MNSNNLTSNNLEIGKIKKTLSKTGWLIALAIGVLGLALIFLSQAASAQSSVVRVDSVVQAFIDDDDDGVIGNSTVRISLSVSGNNVLVPNTEGEEDNGNYPIASVEDKSDCEEDAFEIDSTTGNKFAGVDATFDITNRRGNYLARANHTFEIGADGDIATADAVSNHDDRYLCLKVTYEDDDGDDDVEYVVSADVLDFEAPMVDDIVVNGDARNQEYNLGDHIDIVVEFSERIFVRKVGDDTGDELNRPYIAMPNDLGNAELVSLGSGTTLIFRYEVAFDDVIDDSELTDLEALTIVKETATSTDDSVDQDYEIVDDAGNKALVNNVSEEIDFRGGEIMVELAVTAMRMGDDRLVVKATPDEYDKDDTDTDTIKSAIVHSSEDAPDVRGSEDPCEDGVKVDGAKYKDASDSDDSDYLGVDLPEDPDDEYYCFEVTDDAGRIVFTNVYHYIVDTTKPRINITTHNNILSITAVDTGSGVNTDSIAWKVLRPDDRCDALGTGAFVNRDDSITIQSSYEGVQICIEVKDNAGNTSYQATVLRYDSAIVITPLPPVVVVPPVVVDPTDPVVVTPTDPVVVNFPPANWDELTEKEQLIWLLTNNPYKCLDTTQIGKDAKCIKGGSALEEGYVVSPTDPTDPVAVVTPVDDTTTPVDDPTTPVDDPTTPVDDPTTPVDDPTTPVDAATGIDLSYDFDESETTITVDAPDIVNLRYAVYAERSSCDDDAEDADFTDVEGDSFEVSGEDVSGQSYVCVRGEDNQDQGAFVHATQLLGEDASGTGDETGDTTGTGDEKDDEGGGSSLVIIIIIVALVAAAAVVVIMLSGKRNN